MSTELPMGVFYLAFLSYTGGVSHNVISYLIGAGQKKIIYDKIWMESKETSVFTQKFGIGGAEDEFCLFACFMAIPDMCTSDSALKIHS